MRERVRDRKGRCVQLEALRGHVDPADPIRAAGRGIARGVGAQAIHPARQRCRRLRGARGATRELLAAFRVAAKLGRKAVERGGKLSQRIGNTCAFGGGALGQLARHVAQRKPESLDRRPEIRCRVGQRFDFARAGPRRDFGVARKLRELAGRDLLAEEQRRSVGQLVCFVEDHGVARGQELRESFVAQHHVGEEKVVVDHDDVGFERRLARLEHKAVGMERAAAAEAVVARGCHLRPDRGVVGHVGQLAAIAGGACVCERDYFREMPRVVARDEAAFRRRAFEMVVADVVCASLEQCERRRYAERGAHERKIALEQLILQRLRAGRYDDLAAVEEGGDEVGERLAGTRPGLGHQRLALGDRARDGVGHCELLRAQAESG